ncbi:MAG: ammonium transporter [Planctomycetaceae bacterium]|nr:ammonium transporter [Planctomycetaceae bacterium]
MHRLALLGAFFSVATGHAADEQVDASPASDAIVEAGTIAADLPLDSGAIAWMLTSSALVLMMVAPGLALFYGGLVRKKNILSVFMQCLFLMGVMSLVWAGWGYSLVFSGDLGESGLIGNLGYAGLNGVGPSLVDGQIVTPTVGQIPRTVHFTFQMMFFLITPALICGAYAERMKFSSCVVFSILWGTVVYCPVAHWVWSDFGWCSEFNPNAAYPALDFAGGTVVHITSGVSALVCAVLLGRRLGFGQEPMPPHNLTYTAIGAALLWMGWFGFNAGSAGAADARAANAFLATHLASAAGVVMWAGLEWVLRGKPTILGACSGAVAGLVCITPASGSVTGAGGIVLGLAAGAICFYACTTLKNQFRYDDSLDAFGVHGVGGAVGALLTGVFATRTITGAAEPLGLLEGHAQQVTYQAVAAGAAALWAVIATTILLKLIDSAMGLRVSQAGELQGLDINQHGEEGYIFY